MTDLTAAMTSQADYPYPPTVGATSTGEQFDTAIYFDNEQEIAPVTKILALESSCKLPNWDGYNGRPIEASTVGRAVGLIRQIGRLNIINLATPFIGPIAAGGIAFEFQVGRRELILSAYNKESAIHYLKSESEEPFDEGLFAPPSPERLGELLAWLTASAG